MAKLRPVKCLHCSEALDRNTEEFVQIGKRYAHKVCQDKFEESKSQETKDREALEQYIVSLYGSVLPLHRKQIKTLTEQGYSYSGILKTLIYFYEIKKNSKEKSVGIGIVPYVYNQAREYYYKLYQIEASAKKVTTNQLNISTRKVKIKPPQIKVKRGKAFNLDALEDEIKNESE